MQSKFLAIIFYVGAARAVTGGNRQVAARTRDAVIVFCAGACALCPVLCVACLTVIMHKSHKKKKNHRNNRQKPEKIENVPDKNSILTGKELFSIKTSDIMGRYVVAKNDIDPGTIIIQESPLVVGPCNDTPSVCLGCYYNFDKDSNLIPYKCPDCEWPLCSPNCSGLGKPFGHSKIECSTLSKQKKGVGAWYAVITPLRCLLLGKYDPEAFKKLLNLESLNEVRKSRPKIWEYNQKYVVERIRDVWGCTEFSEDLIHTICGILEVNAFEVGQNGISVRAIYPTAFLLAHDCVPNTTHTDDESNNYRLIVRSATFIPGSEIITLSYAYTLQNTLLRRQHLWDSKFFWCDCKRCRDPTELQTNAGTLLCPRCKLGHVLSTNPLEPGAPWKCINGLACPDEYTIPASTVQLLTHKISDEIESIDSNNVKQYEDILFRYRNVLHTNHFHFLGVKHSLSQLYGKIADYMIQDLPKTLLERKIDICREILTVFDVLEPGLSRLRGVTLYELHAPLMIQITRDFECKNIAKMQLKKRLKEVVTCLRDAEKILGFEPRNSVEGVMACAAKDALNRVKDWEKILGRI